MIAEPAIGSSFAQTLKWFKSHFNKSMITLQQMKQYAPWPETSIKFHKKDN